MNDDIFSRFKGGKAKTAAGVAKVGEDSTTGFKRIREAELLAAVDRLPALPAVVQQIIGSLGSEVSGGRELEDLISQDMVITGRLLKLVNSPFYMLPNEVASIQQAVAIIGMRSLRSLVVAVTSADLMNQDLAMYGFVDKGLWINSMVTAGLARRIAESTGVPGPSCDEIFIAALMRDIGMLVLGPFMSKAGITLGVDPSQRSRFRDIIELERKRTRFDHCWVGERIAEKWSLPESIRLIISRHHRVPATATPEQLKEMAIVRLAERMAYNSKAGVVGEHPFDAEIDNKLIKTIGLDTDAFRELVMGMPDIIKTAVADTQS